MTPTCFSGVRFLTAFAPLRYSAVTIASQHSNAFSAAFPATRHLRSRQFYRCLHSCLWVISLLWWMMSFAFKNQLVLSSVAYTVLQHPASFGVSSQLHQLQLHLLPRPLTRPTHTQKALIPKLCRVSRVPLKYAFLCLLLVHVEES